MAKLTKKQKKAIKKAKKAKLVVRTTDGVYKLASKSDTGRRS